MADRLHHQNSALLTDTNNLLSRVSSQPSTYRKNLIDCTIYQFKVAGIWDKFDACWFMAAHDSQTAKLNWKSSSYNLTELGTMNFVADRGYTRNGAAAGTTDALDTNYIPSVNGVKALLNSNSLGVYSRSNVNEATCDIGCLNASNVGYNINSRNGGNFQIRNNSATSISTAVSDSLGMFSVVRSASTFTALYKNGSFVSSSAAASSALSNFSLYLNAANINGSISAGSTRQLAFAYIGSPLIDQAKLYSIVQFYMNGVGAAV